MPANRDHIKTNPITRFTKEAVRELEACAHPVTGPRYFLENFFWISHPKQGKMQFKPYSFQLELLDTYHRYNKSINMCGRQMGKTTVSTAYLLWYAMFKPDSTILIAANKEKIALEIMGRIQFAYHHVPDHIRSGINKTYNKGSMEFHNGSRILAETTTETTGRGMSISLLYLDEFAFVPHNQAKEFWTSIQPTISTGGKCIMTSTPNSDEDLFATIWYGAKDELDEHGNVTEVGKNGFKWFKAKWDADPLAMIPPRDEKWEKEAREGLGEATFDREHNCKFIIHDETLIDSHLLSVLKGRDPVETMGEVRWYKLPERGMSYVLGLDPSVGTGGNYAAIQVVELPTLQQVAEWQNNRVNTAKQVRTVRDILDFIADEVDWDEWNPNGSEIYWSVENNGVGEAALADIRNMGEEHFRGTLVNEPRKLGRANKYRRGFNTGDKSKTEACNVFKRLVETEKMKLHSRNLLRELKSFVALGNSFRAKAGETDDLIAAMLVVFRQLAVIARNDDDVARLLNPYADDPDLYDENAPVPFGSIVSYSSIYNSR